jgi:hypothetical protein
MGLHPPARHDRWLGVMPLDTNDLLSWKDEDTRRTTADLPRMDRRCDHLGVESEDHIRRHPLGRIRVLLHLRIAERSIGMEIL